MKRKETGPRRKRVIWMTAAMAVGVLIAWGAAAAKGLKPGIGTAMALRCWSDGCFAAAVLIGGVGALTWISTTGIFDIFRYGFSSAIRMFVPFLRLENQMSFLDYKIYREEKRQPARMELLAVGVLFLAVSALLLAAYAASGGA